MQEGNDGSLLFEIRSKLGRYNMSIGIGRRGLITGKIDFAKKEIEIRLTETAVKKGIGILNKKLEEFNKKLEEKKR